MTMPRTLQEILDHADELAAQFEAYEPRDEDHRDVAPLLRAREAVQSRARAEAEVAAAVAGMRAARYSWATIGGVLGTTGEAVRQRYAGVEASRSGRVSRGR